MTGTSATPPRVALVYNPIKSGTAGLPALVQRRSEAAGWGVPLVRETTVEDSGQGATRDVLAEGVAAVLVAGGDGTVRAVAEAMNGSGVPLTIVPSGTGNLLARNLQLPLDRAQPMIDATFSGSVQPIDIGVARIVRPDGSAQEHAFVVLAGMGLDAEMVTRTRPVLKRAVGWLAYVEGAARSLSTSTPFRIMYQLDDGRLRATRVHSLLFANCGALPAGISLVPEASFTDGLLDVALVQPRGWLGWANVVRRVWWENSVLSRTPAGRRVIKWRGNSTAVNYLQGQRVEAATPTPQHIQLDGDEFGEASRLECRVEKGTLLVTLPERSGPRSRTARNTPAQRGV